MKRFVLLLAATTILIPAAGCEDTGGGGGKETTPPPATTTPAPNGKASPKISEANAKAAARAANPHGPKNDR